MAKLLILLLLVATAVAAVFSAPTEGEYSLYPEDYQSEKDRGRIRPGRDVSCDVFGGLGVGEIACMSYCYTTKQTSGHCDDITCICN